MNTNPLLQQKCQPLEGGKPMPAAEIEARLREAPGWALQDGAIEKTYRFENYHQTMAFVNALAWIAHAEDHHPDLLVTYGSCQVRFNTHSVGGISINDFICAAKADALLG
ncbi:4a-hydroxytetrahydrobiopterin dehydratase [Caldimonas brevitalea]|uniref:Putative pterin-4-alpha-carbinolamine dehydratase n=1 Tax=Caldimonas brevitalea TaxID=413882 RepID=A0A0G3BLX3_9BURK|nr:4a-hydroxytetrahydrobiopterin dehydratase [Caldimonas brevitalea]AKJ30439.1 pterin dehydratase [Caldimonas brevitalea]